MAGSVNCQNEDRKKGRAALWENSLKRNFAVRLTAQAQVVIATNYIRELRGCRLICLLLFRCRLWCLFGLHRLERQCLRTGERMQERDQIGFFHRRQN